MNGKQGKSLPETSKDAKLKPSAKNLPQSKISPPKKIRSPPNSKVRPPESTSQFKVDENPPQGNECIESSLIFSHSQRSKYHYFDPPKKVNFKFRFTGSTKEHFKEGIPIELKTSMNHQECLTKLQEELCKNGVKIDNKTLIIFLPGGIPFNKGKIMDVYFDDKIKVKPVIYGVLVKKFTDSDLNKKIYEVCNASDEYHRSLLSPHCESTERGLSDMACLLGYFNRDCKKSDYLINAFAYTIHFAPLLTSLKKIIKNEGIVGCDVVTVCSTLFTYFRFIIPSSINDNKLLEHVFPLCNLFNIDNDKVFLIPLYSCRIGCNLETMLMNNLKLEPFDYIWAEDYGSKFEYDDNNDDIDFSKAKENDYFDLFLPIAPLSLRTVFNCSVIKGKEREYFYLMPSLSKSYKCQNMIIIIDPISGKTESKDLETFAKEQIDQNENDTTKLINRNLVKQIVMFNLDESKSMMNDNDNNLDISTVIQYMSIFVNNNYNYHYPTIQGLVSFNNKINLKCPFTPLVTEFENKAFSNIEPKNKSKLWDSIIFSCNEICKFRNDDTGKEKFSIAQSRIIVISNGRDDNSESKPEDVVKELVSKRIIVDCIIINNNVDEDGFKMLCAICHATGGFIYRPANIEEGISFIKQNAFLDINDRRSYIKPLIPNDRKTSPCRLRNQPITEDFMNQAKDNSESDTKIESKMLLYVNANIKLATPLHIVSNNCNVFVSSHRIRRILKELHYICEVNDPNNEKFDPDIKVYPARSNIDRWNIFIKGPEGTPYENKWWFLYMHLPEYYPYEPPIFRFISIPYHLNVSTDGVICLNILDKGYMKSKYVIKIIQQIKELFLLPSIDTPLRFDAYDLFMNNRNQYDRLAKESANSNAKTDFKAFLNNPVIVDDVNSDFKLNKIEEVPLYMISQISGNDIKKENLIMASSGVYYDKNELNRLLETSKNPICVITGKVLTEKIDDI